MVQVQLKHHVRPWRKPPRSWASVTRFYRSILENRRPHDANALVMLHEPAPGEHGAGSQGQTSFVSGGFAAVTTRGPAAGAADEKTAGLRRQAGAQLTNSLVRVARPALVTPFAGLAGVLGVPASEIGPAACSTARSATTCVASRRVAAAYGVAHLALRTPFYVQNHDARSAWEHWSKGVVLFRSRGAATQLRRVFLFFTRLLRGHQLGPTARKSQHARSARCPFVEPEQHYTLTNSLRSNSFGLTHPRQCRLAWPWQRESCRIDPGTVMIRRQ